MPSWSRISRFTTFSALAAAPVLALSHTGVDGGEHHNFLDELAHGVSDLDGTAALLALGVGILVLVVHQWVKRSAAERQRRRAADPDRKL
ncbi:MAG: hypothetical protein V4757_01045 [Pseudomonadota bacterium]